MTQNVMMIIGLYVLWVLLQASVITYFARSGE